MRENAHSGRCWCGAEVFNGHHCANGHLQPRGLGHGYWISAALVMAFCFGVGLLARPAHAQQAGVQIQATGTIAIQWEAPTQNVDGSALLDLSGYKLYWGYAPGNYTGERAITDEAATSATVQIDITQVGTTTVYAALTALNDRGQESAYSNEITRNVNLQVSLPPQPPGGVQMQFTVDGCVVLNVPGATCSVEVTP